MFPVANQTASSSFTKWRSWRHFDSVPTAYRHSL